MTAAHESLTAHQGARPTVMLSGMLGDESLWEGVIDRLAPTRTVLCLRSDTGDTVSEVAASALEASPSSFTLVGHSLGGIIALEMLRQAPARVERVALFSASARSGSPAQQSSWLQLRGRTTAGEFDAVVRELAVATLAEQHRSADLVARNVAMAEEVGPEGFLRQLVIQAGRPDSRPGLAGIDVPALVAMGEYDQVCPPALQHEVADGIPGSVTKVIAGCGHMTPLEAPGQVAALLEEWWSSDVEGR